MIRIEAQPCCPPKLRYRTSYTGSSTRRDALKGSSSIYPSPTVRISLQQCYLAPFIGVSLSTVSHSVTKHCYVHPYIIESIDHKEQNDTKKNIVWYSLENLPMEGIFIFPDLRIVRIKEDELERAGDLRLFYDHNSSKNLVDPTSPKGITKRKIVPEYNLRKGLLAFFIGQKQNENDEFPTMSPETIVFSEEMTLISEETSNEDTEPNVSPILPTDCAISKWAPRFGFTDGGEEMIVICTKSVDKRKYGDVQLQFESNDVNISKLQAESISIEGNIIYFKMPCLNSSIDGSLHVKIKVQQKKRDLGVIEYEYLKKNECLTCQMNRTRSANLLSRSNSNKRPRHGFDFSDMESDGIVPVSASESTPVLRQSKSESSSINNEIEVDVLKKIEESMHTLFRTNDFTSLFRIFRIFIQQRPELFHHAIENNYSNVIIPFVSVAGNLLEHRNDQGETPLLQAIRLNRVDFVRALLQRKNANEFLTHVNNRTQNIFHILAKNNKFDELFQLIINHLVENSIQIKENFDRIDDDNHTPLQIAIRNHNVSAVEHLFKYSDKEIVQTLDCPGENLIHFTVRYGDLTILKYFLDKQELIEQGHRSSLTMTPFELATTKN